MRISSVRIQNFKAIHDSGTITFTPLTAFVGYNGTGKSSLIEALEFFRSYALFGLEEAISPWHDFSNVLWQGIERERSRNGFFLQETMSFKISGKNITTIYPEVSLKNLSQEARFLKGKKRVQPWKGFLDIGLCDDPDLKERIVAIKEELFSCGELSFRYQEDRKKTLSKEFKRSSPLMPLSHAARSFQEWLFLSIDPKEVGLPKRYLKSNQTEFLSRSGSNLSIYLSDFLKRDPSGFDSMLETLRHILPYVQNLRPEIIKDAVETRSLLRMTESFPKDRHVIFPGWVLSSGTLRVLTLLAALRHPMGPEVIFIEEPENGLDPRSIGLLVEEIRRATESGKCQVILSTHSPYLLDKLSLDHIVTVERPHGGEPVFSRPADQEELRKWSEKFAPGSLYTMGMLRDHKG